MHLSRRAWAACAAALILAGAGAVTASALSLEAPRLVLNRSLFLVWDEYAGAGFSAYEVYASTAAGFAEEQAVRVAQITDPARAWLRLRGLNPATRYYFRVRLKKSGGDEISNEVNARTLADGVNETVVPALMYHVVQPRAQFPSGYDAGGWYSSENFTRDLDYFRQHGVNTVTHQEILDRINSNIPLPPNPVLLSFDDAYQAFGQHAVPILLAHDYVAVNAVVTRKTGGLNDWAVPEWPATRLATWAEIKACQRAGMWMGSHTQTHPDLNLETNKWGEIAGSRDDLIAQLKVHPEYFCYPWGMAGRRNQAVLDRVSAAGYTLATRTWPPEIGTIASDRFWFPREFANQTDTLRSVLVKLRLDTDKDGLQNYRELDWGLRGDLADSDGDGLSDAFESAFDGNPAAYNPFGPGNPTGRDLNALLADSDADGLTDGAEILTHATNPFSADTDADGLTDGAEVVTHGTDPARADSDGDGMPDGLELARGRDPRVREPAGAYAATAPLLGTSLWIECENFDYGGAGVAYTDATAVNEGGVYRPAEGVDVSAHAGASNGFVVGWTRAGEWLHYTINVISGATYTAQMRAAAAGAGGAFRIEIANGATGAVVAVPNSGSWTAYRDIPCGAFDLATGVQTVRVAMVTQGASGYVGAFDGFSLRRVPGRQPFPAGTPHALPGRIECEDYDEGGAGVAYQDATAANEGGRYRPAEGVDLAADTGAGNGHVVGWTPAGEWLEYTVAVATDGLYTVEARVAALGAGGRFRIEVDGGDATGALVVPDTGGWNRYQVVSKENIALTAGPHRVRLVMAASGASGNTGAFDWFQIVAPPPPPPPPAQGAYPAGVPWALPGRIECEDFDTGGTDAAYQDATAANEGGRYRPAEGVDLAADAGAGNGHVVGWTPAGEWLEYTVAVATDGVYTVETRVAAVGTGGRFQIAVDGLDATGPLAVPNTGAWNVYQVVAKSGVSLAAGPHVLRLTLLTAGTSGHVGAFDWIGVSAPGVVTRAYPAGVAWTLPGTIECENFDTGGQAVAYNDTTVANEGGQYRVGDRVDIGRDTGAGNSHVVGWTKAGEWLEYTVNVTTGGTYTLETRVAAVGAGGQFKFEVDGTDVTGPLAAPHTGAWNVYQVVSKSGVNLTVGQHVIRLVMVANGPSGFVGAFDWWRAVLTAPAPLSLPLMDMPLALSVPAPADGPWTTVEASSSEAGEAWAVVDGDLTTGWRGLAGDDEWWLGLGSEDELRLADVRVRLGEGSLTNLDTLGSLDGLAWQALVLPLTNGPIRLRHLLLVFPNDHSGRVPDVREVEIAPAPPADALLRVAP